ncbi:3D domain-containing protein [Caldisalinibacter kiritimatiensis]|uniref:Putative cell wall-binding protein n=1 Tax=Caldisalinibacter kiritimatiensis TaxID=1304284 RepID=R1CUD0_9FIRM|nr:3D domain-containing protein [Caldisalinibacter kiritimatiensis]EOD00284.1 putative cell wall-binding protein [Caldisalinibacter kiritimatiensis]
MSDKIIKNKLFSIIVVTFLIVISSVLVYQHVEKDVVLYIDGQSKVVKTYSKTVGELLQENRIELEKKDYINVDEDMRLKDNMNIVIRKALPVTVYDGKIIMQDESSGKTVEDVLKDLNIKIDENDEINPDLDKEISSNTQIYITRVDEEIKSEIQEIPYDTIIKYNENLLKGEINKIQHGKNGKKELEIKETYINGELKSKKILSEKIKVEPKPEIIEKGTKHYIATSRGNVTFRRKLIMTATAYDLSYQSTGKRPGDPGYGITATGTKARPGVVAVDPNVIPLGTKLYIESLDSREDYGFAVAEDTGGAVKGNRIDLFFADHQEALKFGRRRVKVYILE